MKHNYPKSMNTNCCVWSTIGRHSLDTLSTVSKKLSLLLFILMLGVGNMWGASTTTYPMSTTSELDDVNYVKYGSETTKLGQIENINCLEIDLLSSGTSSYCYLVTKTSFSNIASISFDIACSAKSSNKLAIETCANSDFSSSVTTIQSQVTFESLPTPVSDNEKWTHETYSLSSVKTGYIRFKFNQGSGGKKAYIKNIVIKCASSSSSYTVTYKNGSTSLGTEKVFDGLTPIDASKYAASAGYNFEGWYSNSELTQSATPATTAITSNKTFYGKFTKVYASGTYNFVNTAALGTSPNILTMTDGKVVSVTEGSRIDNIFFGAMSIKYESGASTALNDYKGWKINTNGAKIAFHVQNNSDVTFSIGSKTAMSVSYTSYEDDDEKTDEAVAKEEATTIKVKAGSLVSLKTTSGETTTLKKIEITSSAPSSHTAYLKNTMNWANAYAYFYGTSPYWDNDKGSGSSGRSGAVTMTYDANTGLFSCPTTQNGGYVAFTKDKQDNYGNFYNTEAIYCNNNFEYDKVAVVPVTNSETKNGTKYYASPNKTNLEFKTVAEASGTGYYLPGGFNSWETKDNEFALVNSVLTYTKELAANTTYEFKVYNQGKFYGWGNTQGSQYTFTESGSKDVYDGNNNLKITTTVQGTYTFTFTESSTKNVNVTFPTARTVTYDINGASGTAPTQANVGKGVEITLASASGLSKTGHDFSGWKCNINNETYQAGAKYTMTDANTTFTAQWTPKNYTLTWALDGGTAGTGTITQAGSVAYGTVLQYTVNPTKTGYDFSAWSPTMTSGTTTMPANNQTYTAQWTPKNYTLTWDLDGGTAGTGEITTAGSVAYGTVLKYTVNPTKAGYQFNGWSPDMTSGTTTMPANDQTYTAQWTAVAPTSVGINIDGNNWGRTKEEGFTLTASPVNAKSDATYQWYLNDVAIQGATNSTFIVGDTCDYHDAGGYKCKVSNGSDALSTTSAAHTVKVYTLLLTVNGKNTYYEFTNLKESGTPKKEGQFNANFNGCWTYQIKIQDNTGNDGWYGYNGTINGNNKDNIQFSQGEPNSYFATAMGGNYIFTIKYSDASKPTLSVTYPVANQESGKTIYFVNNQNWSNLHYRIGHNTHSAAQAMTKVSGTDSLYKVVTEGFNSVDAWSIANQAGWQGSNKTIYQPYYDDDAKTVKPNDSYAITRQTVFQKYLVTDPITLTPSTFSNNANNCDYWNVEKTNGMLSHTATITAPTNGTITVAYTDVDNTAKNFTSGEKTLAHTCNLTITGTPAQGYELTTLTVNDAAFTSGNKHVLSADATIAATFTAQTYQITYKDQNDQTFSGTHGQNHPTTHTYGTATQLVSPTKTGYTFDGWFGNSDCTGTAMTSVPATTYTADFTLYAKWTANTYTLTLKANDGASTEDIERTVTYDAGFDATGFTPHARTGYTIKGYYTTTSGGDRILKNDGGWSFESNKDGYTGSQNTWHRASNTDLHAQWTAQEYTITYKDKGNTTYSGSNASSLPAKHTYGTATTLVDGVKSGYTFDGWFTSSDCSGTAITSLGATAYTSAITLYAKWTENPGPGGESECITWVLNLTDKSSTVDTKTKVPSDHLTNLTNVALNKVEAESNSGKTTVTPKISTPLNFATDSFVSISFKVADNFEFHPTSVTLKTVAVSSGKYLKLVFTDGINTSSKQKTDKISTSSSPTKYTLTEFPDSALTGTITLKIYCYGATNKFRLGDSINVCGTLQSSSPTTTYTVTYAANGGSGTMTDSNSPYTAGAQVTLLSNTFTAPTGKQFSSWLVKDASDNTVTVTSGKFTMPSSNVTVTAQWTDAPTPGELTALVSGTLYKPGNMLPSGKTISGSSQYCSGLSANGKFYIIGDALQTKEQAGVPEIKTSDSKTYGDCTSNEYLFFKGAPNKTGNVPTSRAIKFKIESTGTLKLYGKDSQTLFKEGASSTIAVTYSNNVWTSSELTAGTYYLYADDGSRNIIGLKFTSSSAPKYTVTYNGNDATSGSAPTDATQYTSGSTVTVKANTGNLARTGYTLSGWNTKADGTGANYTVGIGTFTITANTTLYAKWISTAPTIGTQPTNVECTVGDDESISVAATISTGGTLAYQWQSSSNGSSGWTDISSATNASYTVPTTSAGTTYYRCVVTNPNGSATATSSIATVIVNEACTAPSITTNPENATLTQGTSATALSVVAAGTAPLSYKWQKSSDNSEWTDISSATSSSYKPSTATLGTLYYRCVVSNECSQTTATSSAATVTVVPLVEKYTIAYVLNDGDTTGTNAPKEGVLGQDVIVPAPSRSGYDFEGWTVSQNLNTPSAKYGAAANPSDLIGNASTLCGHGANQVYFRDLALKNQTVTLYAHWHKTCSGGGSGSGTATTMTIFNGTSQSATLPTKNSEQTDPTTGAKYTAVNTTASNTTSCNYTYDGVNYKSSWQMASSATGSGNRYVQIVIPSGYTATIKLVAYSSSNQNRSVFVSDKVTSDLQTKYGYVSFSSTTTLGGTTTSSLKAGTYYVCATNGIYILNLSVTLTSTGGGSGETCYYVTYSGTNNVASAIAGATSDSAKYANNATVTVKANGFTAPTNCVFKGWNTKQDGSGDTKVAGTGTFTITKDTTLYAMWKRTYTVVYDENGAESGTVPTDASSPYESGTTVTVLGNTGSLAKEGFTFDGWNTQADGTGIGYAATNTFSIQNNVRLYAQWKSSTSETAEYFVWNTGNAICGTREESHSTLITECTYIKVTSDAGNDAYKTGTYYTTGTDNGNTITFSTVGGMLIREACIYGKAESARFAYSYNGGATWDTVNVGLNDGCYTFTDILPQTPADDDGVSSITIRNITETGEEAIYLRNAWFGMKSVACTKPATKIFSCNKDTIQKGSNNPATLELAATVSGTTYFLQKDGKTIITTAKEGNDDKLTWEVSEAGVYTAHAFTGTDMTKTSCNSNMQGEVRVVVVDLTISGNKSVTAGKTTTLSAVSKGGKWSIIAGSEYASIGENNGIVQGGEDVEATQNITVQYTLAGYTSTYDMKVVTNECSNYKYYADTNDGSTDTDVFKRDPGHNNLETLTAEKDTSWTIDDVTYTFNKIQKGGDTIANILIPAGQRGTLYLAARTSGSSRRDLYIDNVGQTVSISGADTVNYIVLKDITSGSRYVRASGNVHVAFMLLKLCVLEEAQKFDFETNKNSVCTNEEFTLTLKGSDKNCSYQLYHNETTPVGSPIAGTGQAITWHYTDLYEPEVTYSVKTVENSRYSATEMNGTPTIQSIRSEFTETPSDISAQLNQSIKLTGKLNTFYPTGTESYTLRFYTCDQDGKNAVEITGAGKNITKTGTDASQIDAISLQVTTPNEAGSYYYKATCTDKCGNVKSSDVVKVNVNSAATITWKLDNQDNMNLKLYQGSQHTVQATSEDVPPTITVSGTGVEILSTSISGTTTIAVLKIKSNADNVSVTASVEASTSHSEASDTKVLNIEACDVGSDYEGIITGYNSATVQPSDDGRLGIISSFSNKSSDILSLNDKAYYKMNSSTEIVCEMDTTVKKYNKFYAGDRIIFDCARSGGGNGGFILYRDSACKNAVCTLSVALTGKIPQQISYTIPTGSKLIDSVRVYIKRSAEVCLHSVTITGYTGEATGELQTTELAWSGGLDDKDVVTKISGSSPFTYTASQQQTVKSLGDILYESTVKTVATVDSLSGQVTLVYNGNDAQSTVIRAILSPSGCYKEDTISYTLTVAGCTDQAGTVSILEGGSVACPANPTILQFTPAQGTTPTFAWYKDGNVLTGRTNDTLHTTSAGEYYVVAHATCDKATNSIKLIDPGKASATALVDSFYIRAGHRLAPVPLFQLDDDVEFVSANLGTLANNDCYMGAVGNTIYLMGKPKTTLPVGDYTISVNVKNSCRTTENAASTKIKVQEYLGGDWTKCKVAFVVTGNEHGGWATTQTAEGTNQSLYKYLDSIYDMTAVNGYNTTIKKEIMQYYSQYDMIILTDYLNTKTTDKSNNKMSYSNAIGYMIDIRPILSFEAFTAGLSNWHIESNPESPKGIQRQLKLLCNAHDIFGTPDDPEGEFKADDVVQITTVRKEDCTKSGQTGLQGFVPQNAPSYVSIATIPMYDGAPEDSVLITCCERQEQIAARMMIFGLNSMAMTKITRDGNKIVHNLVNYMLIKEPADLPDCAIVFSGLSDKSDNWSDTTNWEGKKLPTMYQPVRIDATCVVDVNNAKAGSIKLNHKSPGQDEDPRTHALTISPNGALAVLSYVREQTNTNPMPHTLEGVQSLKILADNTGTGTLIFDNNDGNTPATVQMFSKANIDGSTWNWQYIGIPHNIMDARNNFTNSWMYKWVASTQAWATVHNGDEIEPFSGYCLTRRDINHTYNMTGTLATTRDQSITLYNGNNLIGNSWTAPINISEFEDDDFSEGVEKTIYIFNTGDYTTAKEQTGATYTASDAGTYLCIPVNLTDYKKGGGELTVIPAMQGFYVKAPAGGGTLTLNYDRLVRPSYYGLSETEPMRAPSRSQQQQRSYGEPTFMKIITTGSTFTDHVLLAQREDFTTGFDNGWDGRQMTNSTYAPQVYAVTDFAESGVAAIPELDGTVIGFRAGEDSEYTISFEYSGFATPLYLFDSETKTYTRIVEGNTYTFSTADKAKHNRFLITSYSGQEIGTGSAEIHSGDEGAKKIILNEHLYIVAPGRLYDGQGKLVK